MMKTHSSWTGSLWDLFCWCLGQGFHPGSEYHVSARGSIQAWANRTAADLIEVNILWYWECKVGLARMRLQDFGGVYSSCYLLLVCLANAWRLAPYLNLVDLMRLFLWPIHTTHAHLLWKTSAWNLVTHRILQTHSIASHNLWFL